MINKDKLAVLVLAAGASTRLGHPKQLVQLNMQPLVVRQCNMALKVSNNVICILGCQAQLITEKIPKQLQDKITLVNNDHWQNGMSSSIVAGVDELLKHNNNDQLEGVMILLVDQWQLKAADLANLVREWRKSPEHIILAGNVMEKKVSPEALSCIGPPVIFPSSFFNELLTLNGEQGAKPLLKKYSHLLKKIFLSSAFVDLDTPEQLLVLTEAQDIS